MAWLLAPSTGAVGEPTIDDLDPGAVSARVDALREASFDSILVKDRRILRIGERLRRAGVDLCPGELRLVWGVIATTERERIEARLAPFKVRQAASQDVELVWVEPGSPAERAGLAVGDVIERLDGDRMRKSTALYRRVEGDAGESVELIVRRDGETRTLSMPLVPGCFAAAGLWLSDEENAIATRDGVYVSRGMMRVLDSDDEIAILLGHEFGHGILQTGSEVAFEADADYIGLYLAARAGYDIGAAPDVFRRMAVRNPQQLVGETAGFRTHPRSPGRVLALQATIREIEDKQAAGDPLVPELPE